MNKDLGRKGRQFFPIHCYETLSFYWKWLHVHRQQAWMIFISVLLWNFLWESIFLRHKSVIYLRLFRTKPLTIKAFISTTEDSIEKALSSPVWHTKEVKQIPKNYSEEMPDWKVYEMFSLCWPSFWEGS